MEELTAIAHDNLPANVKHCLALQGRAGGWPRAPMPATSPAHADPIRQGSSAAGVI
jgi:dihydrodipicolinate synthase/N-acetylneuraminate lyase